MSDLQILSGRLASLDRRRTRGAWGVGVLTHYVKPEGAAKAVMANTTITGNVAIYEVGDRLDVLGAYEESNYGKQFKAARIELAPPDTEAEMNRWFTEKLPHIGDVRIQDLRKLADTAGKSLRDYLDTATVEELATIPGITPDRALAIVETWARARALHDQFEKLIKLGLTADEIKDIVRNNIDLSGIDKDPFVFFDEEVVSMNRLTAMLKASYPALHGGPAHRARLVLHSVRELIEDTGSTAADSDDVLEHLKKRAPGATLAKLRNLADEVPGVFEVFGFVIQPARLARAEATIATFVRHRT